VHPLGMSAAWLTDWDRLLETGGDAVLEVLTSRAPLSVELRQNPVRRRPHRAGASQNQRDVP